MLSTLPGPGVEMLIAIRMGWVWFGWQRALWYPRLLTWGPFLVTFAAVLTGFTVCIKFS